MTSLEDVETLIVESAPDALCDDCIAEELRLSVRQHANHKARKLALCAGFERRIDRCVRCGKDKTVIRYEGRP